MKRDGEEITKEKSGTAYGEQKERNLGYWQGKTPCWEMTGCPKAIKIECPAIRCESLPCWQIEGTFRKIFDYEQGGDGTAMCRLCEVYKKYGGGEPIEIKLLVKDFHSVPETISK